MIAQRVCDAVLLDCTLSTCCSDAFCRTEMYMGCSPRGMLDASPCHAYLVTAVKPLSVGRIWRPICVRVKPLPVTLWHGGEDSDRALVQPYTNQYHIDTSEVMFSCAPRARTVVSSTTTVADRQLAPRCNIADFPLLVAHSFSRLGG